MIQCLYRDHGPSGDHGLIGCHGDSHGHDVDRGHVHNRVHVLPLIIHIGSRGIMPSSCSWSQSRSRS